jgi:hypothetical protein
MNTPAQAQASTVKEVKRFVIAKAMIGKNITLKFTNKKGQLVEYNHDKVYEQLKDKFEAMPCFAKYKNYTNTNDLPVFVRNLKEII